ncbi:MAG: 1-acyl-sn-glycerol-3-phosphate acyltransferase [Deltaproteobacteria bacterium]|nr:1-acyl-sn-glycerol-3-phosphate acyltransferase [Deltaproteobacteria bacterium]
MSREVLLEHARPPDGRPPGRAPVFRTILYTLDISLRFLWAAARGRGSVAVGDRLIAGYWPRILRSGNAKLSVVGRENFPPGQACVVMSNHSSLLDIPALMGAVPGSVRMVTKEELTRVPIWGRALVASGFVAVDRKDRQKAIAQLEKAKDVLRQGVHVWIAPEGTRSRTGVLGPFKKGGFHLARDLGVPIVPAWIAGAHDIIPPDQFVVGYDGEIEVRFGAPIATAGVGDGELDGLREQVRLAMVALADAAAADAAAMSAAAVRAA